PQPHCQRHQGPALDVHRCLQPTLDEALMTMWKRATAGLLSLLCAVVLMPGGVARADNPIVQTIYTADPAPLVHNGRVYLYTGHDEDGSTWFTMREWRVWSSADMVNWTDHGSPMSLSTFSWAKAD